MTLVFVFGFCAGVRPECTAALDVFFESEFGVDEGAQFAETQQILAVVFAAQFGRFSGVVCRRLSVEGRETLVERLTVLRRVA